MFIIDKMCRKIESGYVKVKFPGHRHSDKSGFVFEHRLICEAFIGRYLTHHEVVHHLDLDKTNNKISNLMLFSNQSEHAKFHLKIRQFGMTQPILTQIKNRWKEYETNNKKG